MAVVKGVATAVEYATDYGTAGSYGAATWTTMPILQLLQEGLQIPTEAAQLQQTINGLDASAAKKTVGVIPFALKDSDTWLAALETAEAEHTPVWIAFTPQGQNPRVIGGATGCLVYVNKNPIPGFGSLGMGVVGFSATGADPGDTFEVDAGS